MNSEFCALRKSVYPVEVANCIQLLTLVLALGKNLMMYLTLVLDLNTSAMPVVFACRRQPKSLYASLLGCPNVPCSFGTFAPSKFLGRPCLEVEALDLATSAPVRVLPHALR